jgi:hypothetical protein
MFFNDIYAKHMGEAESTWLSFCLHLCIVGSMADFMGK